jgi:hypothetical protein
MTDESCRIGSRELLKPQTPYDAERREDGRIVLTDLTAEDVPVVQPRRVGARLRGAEIIPTRDTVAAAVRAIRDER